MKRKSITDILLEKYQKDLYETSKKLSLTDTNHLHGYESYLYEDLPNIDVRGYPIGSDYVYEGKSYSMNEHEKLPEEIKKRCKLRYHYLPLCHEFYLGTTGSGKTTGCVEPHIRALAYQKNKPNLFITDPKGEIYNHNAEFLANQGYKLFVLNFKNVEKSDKWNPLLSIYDSYMRLKLYFKQPEFVLGRPGKNVDTSRIKCLEDNGYVLFDGKAFENFDDFYKYKNLQTDLIISETDDLIKQLSFAICPVTNTHDQSWEMGGQQAFQGIINCMLEDALNEEETGFTKDMFTIKTIFDYLNQLNLLVLPDDYNNVEFSKLSFIKGRTKGIEKMSIIYNNSPRTRRNYIGILEGQLGDWRQGHIFSLTTGNTIDYINIDQPFAIFVITRDTADSDFKVAGLFIDEVYKKLVEHYDDSVMNGIIPTRHTHFILDEFGNIPKIESFQKKIATCRSRNIWMHLFLQSYDQLEKVYDNDTAEIIISNCNSQIFLGSQSFSSIDRFSKECGITSVRKLNPSFQETYEYQETHVVKMTDLSLIEPGCMYNKRIFTPVIQTQYIRSYYLAQNGDYKNFTYDGLIKIRTTNFEGFTEDKYNYTPVTEYTEDDDY